MIAVDADKLKGEIADLKAAIQTPSCDYLTGYISALSVVEGMIATHPTITLDDLRQKGRWEKFKGTSSGWEQHRCSVCKAEAIFEYTYIDDYDEGIDGEWECIGQKEDGIIEHLTDFCPHCGADMRGGREDG